MNIPETIRVLEGRRVLLGVTGSIAAYKAAELASGLTKAGSQVDVILTDSALEFVTELTFQSLTGRQAYTEEALWGAQAHVVHVGMAEGAEAFLISPATAHSLAKIAQGLADNLLTLTALAASCPIIVAPAMDVGMYNHPATQKNLKTLKERDVVIVEPEEGRMASGHHGVGRMVSPEKLLGHLRLVLGRGGALRGRRVVVTAGGTREPLDPVRVLTNRSSGKQGYALAQAALDSGAQVQLITAPTCLPAPVGAKVVHVETAEEMGAAALEASAEAEVLLMAAAVADFRPTQPAAGKLKRRAGVPKLDLEPTGDILGAVVEGRRQGRGPRVVVGFAAESDEVEHNARKKLVEKGMDLIVANDISLADSGFDVDTNRVTLIAPDHDPEQLPLMSKARVAERVVDRVVQMLEDGGAG